MQTVNFQCGHCRKLMAVSTDYLGKQVRCPHCQQVVVAPASASPPVPVPPAPVPAPPPPPPPMPSVPPPVFLDPNIAFDRSESDSIFGPPPQSEDLFDAPPPPRLEMPAPAPFMPIPPPSFEPPPTVSEPIDLPQDSTLAYESAPDLESVTVTEEPAPFVPPSDNGIPGLPNDGMSAVSDAPLSMRRSRRSVSEGLGLSWPWFFKWPLLSYAVFATVLLIILAFKIINAAPTTLLDQIPDLNGDNPGIRKKEHSWTANDKLTRLPLPAKLRTSLGKPLAVGALEVTPVRVEQKKVAFFDEKVPNKAWPCESPSLVLHLTLRNLARDYSFTPLDNYFDRKYLPKSGDVKPFTQLEISNRVFYGGPAEWYPLKRAKDDRHDRQWLEGRKNFDAVGLGPGESMDTFVCTDGNDRMVTTVTADYEGPFLWRVHLRRGLVRWKGRDLSATAVVGVEFTHKDIKVVDE